MFFVYGLDVNNPIIFVWILLCIIAIYKGFRDYRRYSPWYGLIIGSVVGFIMVLLNIAWVIQGIVVLAISLIGIYISNR